MSTDIHVFLLKKNRRNNEWEEIELYRREKISEKMEVVPFYSSRDTALFDLLSEIGFSLVKNDLPQSIISEISLGEGYYFGFKEITLADFIIILNDTFLEKDNKKLKNFLDKIYNYLNIYDSNWQTNTPLSDIRIIYWFDN